MYADCMDEKQQVFLNLHTLVGALCAAHDTLGHREPGEFTDERKKVRELLVKACADLAAAAK